MKNRIKKLLKKREFQYLFFIVSTAAFSMPILATDNLTNPFIVFLLLMGIWPVVIFIMYLQEKAE